MLQWSNKARISVGVALAIVMATSSNFPGDPNSLKLKCHQVRTWLYMSRHLSSIKLPS